MGFSCLRNFMAWNWLFYIECYRQLRMFGCQFLPATIARLGTFDRGLAGRLASAASDPSLAK